MAVRQLLLLLFLLAVIGLGILNPRLSHSAAPDRPQPVPPEAVRAMREGRYLHASLLMRRYLEQSRDSSGAAILLSAQADARVGDWERVAALLRGRSWLDTLGGGLGWELLGRSQLELGQWGESDDSYARFLAVSDSGAGRAQGLALARQALARSRSGEYAEAVSTYRKAARQLPEIADWLHVFAASAAASAGDTAEVEEQLAEAGADLRAEWGWRARVRARRNAQQTRSALAITEQVAEHGRTAALRAEANARTGDLRLQLGDSGGARVAYLRAARLAPSTTHALDAARALGAMRHATPDDHRAVGELFLRHGNLERGRSNLQIYLTRGAPTADERMAVQLALGQALFRAGRYADAERLLLTVAETGVDPRTAAAAAYQAARAQYRDGRAPQAQRTLQRIIDRHPTQPAAAQAAFLLADLAHDAGDEARAREYYRLTSVLDPASDHAGQARMRLAGMALVHRQYAAAVQEYDAYLAAFPTGRRAQQAAYFAARARIELGRRAEANMLLRQARDVNPFSYYGVRSAELLGQDFWDTRLGASPARSEHHEQKVARVLSRIELLNELGWHDASRYELERARRHFASADPALYALAEGLNERGHTWTGVALGWDLYRRDGIWNPRLLRIIYPFPYQQIILAEAAARNVDPFLAAGLIRQESMFDPRARSGAGAVGLMQVMPGTGKTLARTLGMKKFSPEMLREPAVNVHLGMKYLADQLNTWNSRVVRVLAAYNAGPTRVQRWRAFPEWDSDELFAERIPFDETRDYVKIVQFNAAVYRALYGSEIEQVAGE